MKKFILTMMVAFTAIIGANAQTIATENTKTFDNIELTVQGGAAMPLDMDHATPLNGYAGLKVGKWLTPIFNFNVEGNAFFGSNHFSTSNTVVRATNVGINGAIDVNNWFGGYNPTRTFSIIPEVGIGWLHQYYRGDDVNDLSAKTAINGKFRVSDAISLVITPTVLWNLTGTHGVQFNKNHAQLALQFGFTYRFKNANGTRYFKEYNITEYENIIARMNEDLAKKPKEVVRTETITVEVPGKTEYVQNEYVVFFKQGSDELNDVACAKLDEIVKAHTQVKLITGYASPEGDKDYNQKLSEDRAYQVEKYLKSKGVTVEKVEGKGVDGPTSNRVAIVTVK